MKMHADDAEGVNLISHVEAGGVRVNREPHAGSVIVPWAGPVRAWQPVDFGALQALHFEQLLEMQPEIVVFGSGASLRFAHPSLLRSLMQHRVGFETMDTSAACRTYNVLAGEGRRVVAALLALPRAS